MRKNSTAADRTKFIMGKVALGISKIKGSGQLLSDLPIALSQHRSNEDGIFSFLFLREAVVYFGFFGSVAGFLHLPTTNHLDMQRQGKISPKGFTKRPVVNSTAHSAFNQFVTRKILKKQKYEQTREKHALRKGSYQLKFPFKLRNLTCVKP